LNTLLLQVAVAEVNQEQMLLAVVEVLVDSEHHLVLQLHQVLL
jgi:hypothetical protein